MSAYALPGLFFFPCSQSSELKYQKNDSAQIFAQKDNSDSWTVTSSHSSDSLGSTDAVRDIFEAKSPSWYKRQKHNLFVTIKSASIDPTRLIHSFTSRKASAATKNTSTRNSFRSSFHNEISGRNRENFLKMFSPRRSMSASLRSSIDSTFSTGSQSYGAEGDLDDIQFQSPPSSPRKYESNKISIDEITIDGEDPLMEPVATPIGRGSFYGIHPVLPLSQEIDKNSTNNDAVQFVLSVDFHGRKYTAARTVPSFIKLREDIIRELAKFHQDHKLDDNPLPAYDQDRNQTNQFSIPDLPIGQGCLLEDMESGAVANVGSACRGFTRLQAMMTSYCPVMEEWLQSVTNLVPDSPSLHDFLWEPMSSDSQVISILASENASSHNDSSDSSALRKSLKGSLRSSISTLVSIEECLMDDEDVPVAMQPG